MSERRIGWLHRLRDRRYAKRYARGLDLWEAELRTEEHKAKRAEWLAQHPPQPRTRPVRLPEGEQK